MTTILVSTKPSALSPESAGFLKVIIIVKGKPSNCCLSPRLYTDCRQEYLPVCTVVRTTET